MDAEHPDPPDPRGGIRDSQETSRKRQGGDSSSNSYEIIKKTIINPATATLSIQNLYVHPSCSESPKFYLDTDKDPFIVNVSWETPDPAAVTSIKHINKINNITSDGVKNIGRNKISVEFSTVTVANLFLSNPILSLCKYVAVILTFNITRMGIVRNVPVDFSLYVFVSQLVVVTFCGQMLPKSFFLYNLFLLVEPYKYPTIQCLKL